MGRQPALWRRCGGTLKVGVSTDAAAQYGPVVSDEEALLIALQREVAAVDDQFGAFGDTNQHGMEGVKFYTKLKTVTARWPEGMQEDSAFVIPTMR